MPTNPSPALATTAERRLQEQLIRQRVEATASFDHLYGAGKELWADGEEFDRFLATVRDTRRDLGES